MTYIFNSVGICFAEMLVDTSLVRLFKVDYNKKIGGVILSNNITPPIFTI